MSACMRCLYSSDHAAAGFWLTLLGCSGRDGVLFSRGAFLAPSFSLSVNRERVGVEEFDWLI